MTVSTTDTRITYQGNGVTTIWNFSFSGGDKSRIRVFITTAGVSTEIFTNFVAALNQPVSPNPTSIGGAVVYPASGPPLAVGNQITIMRDLPDIQPYSFANQGTLYQEIVEKAIDNVVMEVQELDAQVNQSLQLPITEEGPLILPGCPERAGKFLGFDANCKPIATGDINTEASNNAIRVPTAETIPPLPSAAARPGQFITFDASGNPILVSVLPPNVPPLFGARTTITAAHTVANSEKGFLLQLTGNTFYDLILGDPTTYDVDFSIAVFNADLYTGSGSGRAKRVMFNGTIMPGGLLWPGQWIYIFRYGSTWVSNPRDQRWKPGVAVTFFADPVLGKDDGTADGLATGAGATKTVNMGVQVALARVDFGGIGTSLGATIQLAQGTYTEQIVINHNTVGGIPMTIKGADDGVDPTPWLVQVAGSSTGILVDSASCANVKGLNFVGTGTHATGIRAAHGSVIAINNCKFGAFPGTAPSTPGFCMWASDNSALNIRDINIAGSATVPFFVDRGSTIKMNGNLNTGNGLAFTFYAAVQYASSMTGGLGQFGDPLDFTLTGGAGCTGTRYSVVYNSIGNLGPGVFDVLPGNAAGVTGASGPAHGTDSSMVF